MTLREARRINRNRTIGWVCLAVGWAMSLVEDEHLPVNMKEKFVTIANAASILNQANNSI